MSITKLQRVNLSQQCIVSIQRYIADHKLKPGDRLPSLQELANLLGVSVLVVRESISALQALGLVDIQHGRGIFINDFKKADFINYLSFHYSLSCLSLKEVVEARAMLELAVLEGCIARADQAAIHELEHILEMIRQDSTPETVNLPLHGMFHQAMLRACGNRLLETVGIPLLNTFWALGDNATTGPIIHSQVFDTLKIHGAYVDAIKRRDFSQTHKLVDDHLFNFCSLYHLYPYNDPDEQNILPDVPIEVPHASEEVGISGVN